MAKITRTVYGRVTMPAEDPFAVPIANDVIVLPRAVVEQLVDPDLWGFSSGVGHEIINGTRVGVDMYGRCFFCMADVQRGRTDGHDETTHAPSCPVRIAQDALAAGR